MQEPAPQIKIGIIDDHNLFRKGLIKLINLGDKHNKYTILFEAANGQDLKDKLKKKLLPDIVLMDIDMPDMDGYEAVAWLRKFYPEVNILVVTMFGTEASILKMLRLGVKGYISKDIEIEDLHNALLAIESKGFYYSDLVASVMAQEIQSKHIQSASGTPSELSENEREFVKLACTDMTYTQIAEKMNLSPKTIEGYREALFSRFNVKSRVALAMHAVKSGWVKI
ncbi:MAG: response regulator transcription factor [Chitinophagaceae bacterium]|nr:response regulator transcription factor [Chitinophagaceae bacterium]